MASNSSPVKERLQAPRGTKDILPAEAAKWRFVEAAVHETARLFGYGEIRTPSFENVKLFKRAVGEETDIVSKEMFLLEGRESESEQFALRPELTAPVVRAAIEHGLLTGQSDCLRFYYCSMPNFRYEKPQLGRLRQHHQFGTELLGPASPLADAETISFAISVFRKLGLKNFKVRLNSLGSKESREAWKAELVPYLRSHLQQLSNDSQRRTETNPLRVLDSKSPQDQEIIRNAPKITDFLNEADRSHFDGLKSALAAIGIEYNEDPLLVRGIDYYTGTVFEVTSSDLGSQDALCGGGRYDNLVEQLGGPACAAVGFGAGIERLLIVLEKIATNDAEQAHRGVYVIAQSAGARSKAFDIAQSLRAAGVVTSVDLNNRSFKAQMREANRERVKIAYIIGESELVNQVGIYKDMETGSQGEVAFKDIVPVVSSELNS